MTDRRSILILAPLLAAWFALVARADYPGPQGLGSGAGLPLTGGTITGDLTVTGALSVAGVTTATVTAPVMVWSSSTAKVLTQAETSGQTWITTGATGLVDLTLPDAPTVGARATFVLDGAYSLVVRANTGDRIRSSAGVTTTAGYLYTTLHASTVTLMRCSATEWHVVGCPSGTWAMDSTTSAGFAYTPTTWTTWTPTGLWTTNTTYTGAYRQVGNMLEVWTNLAFAGVPDTGTLYLITPPGVTVDTTKLPGGGAINDEVGVNGMVYDNAGPTWAVLGQTWNAANPTRIYPNGGTSSLWAGLTRTVPVTLGAGDSIRVTYRIPVQ